MSFIRSRSRPARPVGPPRAVLAVGRRVFVHATPDAARLVSLTNEHGIPGAAVLRDGTEVEVLAWRPRGSAGTRYRVCARPDGTDGWLAADELRTTAVRVVAQPAPEPEPAPGLGRPFGSRR